MARNCGCAGASCGCKIISNGNGIQIWGIGTEDDPYLIGTEIGELEGVITFTDSASVNFTVVGQGTQSDPMVVTAVTIPAPFPVYTTAGRPSAITAGAGAFYYDTTTKLPMWSDGAEWKTAITIPGLFPKVGSFLMPDIRTATAGASALTAASQTGTPVLITRTTTVDAIMGRVTTLEAATSVKLLLYSGDADGHPTTLVATATIDASSTGFKTGVLGAPVVLTPGLYWVFSRSNSPGSLVRIQACTPNALQQVWLGSEGIVPTAMSIAAAIGTYAAPAAALAAWTYVDAGTTICPWFGLRRSA